ncbi:hypothetical protein [Hyphomicrobium sp. 2TAF46]|uniref:hypothetical protein n=1 Tax=Hyphomicrobium sp. 2TAF46 TaxID=3233019 RepID=UPI003F910617
MNMHFTMSGTMSGAGSVARQRALILVRDAIAKREASLASLQAQKLSVNDAGSINRPSSQGGK